MGKEGRAQGGWNSEHGPRQRGRGESSTDNKSLHHALIAQFPVGVLVEDDSRRILEVNERLCEMFGCDASPTDLIGADCAQAAREYAHLFVDPEGFVSRIEEILRQRRPVAGEQLTLADGRVFERDYVPTFVGEGYRGHLWHYRDLTGKQPEGGELQRQRDLLRTIIDSAGETVFVKDLEHRFLLSNRQHQTVLGAESQNELLGKTNADIWGAERAAPHHADDRLVMDHGESLIGREEEITHASGERRWLSTTKVPLRDHEGRITGLVAVSRDVTERKRYEEALQESERRLAEAQSLARVGSWEWDVVSDSISWSAQQYRNFGLAPENFKATFEGTMEHVHPEDRDHMARVHRESMDRGGSFEWEYRLVRPDGEVRHMHTRGRTFTDERGEPVRMAGADHDLTERKAAERALRQSEERFRQLFEQSVDALLVHDEEGRYVDVNVQACRLYGYSREELLSLSVHDTVGEMLTGEEKARRERRGGTPWQQVMSGEPGVFALSFEDENRRKDGSVFTAEVRLGSVDYGGRRLMLVAVRDITERKRAEEALRKSEQRLRAVTDGAPVVLFAMDSEGVFTFEAGAGLDALGRIPGHSVGLSVFEAYPQYSQVIENVQRALDGEEVVATVELRGFAFASRYSPVWSETGLVEGVIGVATDITDRRELERGLEYQALHDSLTGLANRDLALERIEQALTRAGRTGGHAAVLFVDLDNFKVVNDSLGHEAGDRLLSAIAGRLRSCVRQTDTAARIGGDEFLVVLDTVDDVAEAAGIARRIHQKLTEPYVLVREEIFIDLSIGIAVGDAYEEGAGELLRKADLAMYRAKAEKETRQRVYDPAMDQEIQDRMAMETDLRRALIEEEFELYYQPKFSVEDGSLAAFEALLRWNHPERGLLLPADFLSVAENLGLIVTLGRWVLGEACRQRREWQDLYPGSMPVKVCVNISGKQLEQTGFVEEVSGALLENGLQPEALGLELTEGAYIGEDSRTVDALNRLRQIGVVLIIDDFGVGYSSLAYLRRLPVQFLKIDRSFTEELGKRNEETTMVRAILEISHAYDIKVIAEGVETAEQLSILRKMGCDLAQGHYFEAALPASRVAALLSATQD